MSADTATPPTLVQRLDAMLAGIRADEALRRVLANPHRVNPMLAAAMGGDARTIAELRAANGELAREVVALKEELWKACRTNAALASDLAWLMGDGLWQERLGADDQPRDGYQFASEELRAGLPALQEGGA
jgi:hypothetical protein